MLADLEKDKRLFHLFEKLHGDQSDISLPVTSTGAIAFHNKSLNKSQQLAVTAITQNQEITIVHGPPGTGKTTTLIEAVQQLAARGEKIIVCAPSNAAVDNICKGLLAKKINLLRVGNAEKTDKEIFQHTPEGKLNNSKLVKEIRQLKLRAEEFRRMALKYKRGFGKSEREQRSLLFKEVKNIRAEIKQIRNYNEEKLFQEAQVVAGTPIGLYDAGLFKIAFDHVIIDEAGQCIEPLAWCVFSLAPKIVLAGDHLQLPPTVLSSAAMQKGLNRSILELAIDHIKNVNLLDIQYRMKPVIAGFSSAYFYNGLLKSADHLTNEAPHLTFIDTAGSGFNETHGPDGISLQNKGELQIVTKLLEAGNFQPETAAFISPYSGQVSVAKELLPQKMRISTIDSFQGQEKPVIVLSLVRSNDNCEIGFLKDYRRMNVAITRAQQQLIIIGDSATIGADPFYQSVLEYIEKHGAYRTVWEFEVD
ncbi:AAA domain-containing protein [Niabella ginsengisoli]|uniref:AAA domain-containing protein n=1 Tax=Niabella ginsengisoli TaxID=522298 RepID=A0ABS9SFD5_9BACT|nr:AAA domain-containing protein [Niabella ginsengisoli]MCH5597077.1 AAA domain-containing protein [Niabella ginsengisoli]